VSRMSENRKWWHELVEDVSASARHEQELHSVVAVVPTGCMKGSAATLVVVDINARDGEKQVNDIVVATI